MSGETQTYWQHRLPKDGKCTTPRINLTFRKIINIKSEFDNLVTNARRKAVELGMKEADLDEAIKEARK
jgi:hypothetical protein